jgi:dTDP-4-amino-4,6-dideoxygalactose transaminase
VTREATPPRPPTPDPRPLPYNRPDIGEEEIAAVVETLRSGWITTGPRTRRFEEEFARVAGARYALALNSATAALHLALDAAGVGPGDEVITTPITFAACANVIVQQGATPVLADVSADDLNIDPEQVERRITGKTKAVMAVHYAGQPCRMDELLDICRGRNLFLLEDAAHATGAKYRDRPVGSIGDATAFSFYATKNLTTGEGGMLTTNRPELEERARIMTLHGMNRDAWKRYDRGGSWYYEVVAPGYKYNLSDLQAALGLVQLARLDEMNARRTYLAGRLSDALRACEAVELPSARPEVHHVWHLYVVRLRTEMLKIDRATFIEELARRGIATSVHFIPIHYHPYYREGFGFRAGDYPVAEGSYERMISLPLYPTMTEEDIDRVAEAVIEVARAPHPPAPSPVATGEGGNAGAVEGAA